MHQPQEASPSCMLSTPPDFEATGPTRGTFIALTPTASTSTVTPLTAATSASQPKYLRGKPALNTQHDPL